MLLISSGRAWLVLSSRDRAAQVGALASAIMLYSWESASLQAGGGSEGLDGVN